MNLHQLKRVKRVVVVVWGWHDMISICWDSLWDVTKALVEAHKASLMSVFYIEDVITILPCDRSWQSSWRKPLIILLLFTTFTQTQHEEWNNNDSSTVSSPPPWQVPRTVLLSFPHFHNFFFLLKYFYTYRLVTFFIVIKSYKLTCQTLTSSDHGCFLTKILSLFHLVLLLVLEKCRRL